MYTYVDLSRIFGRHEIQLRGDCWVIVLYLDYNLSIVGTTRIKPSLPETFIQVVESHFFHNQFILAELVQSALLSRLWDCSLSSRLRNDPSVAEAYELGISTAN